MAAHLGEFEQLVLFALLRLDDEAYGVGIRRQIEERTGRDVSAGAVYTTLSRLEARGLVRSRQGAGDERRAGRPRKYYRLTRSGAATLQRCWSDLSGMAKGLLPKLADAAGDGQGR